MGRGWTGKWAGDAGNENRVVRVWHHPPPRPAAMAQLHLPLPFVVVWGEDHEELAQPTH